MQRRGGSESLLFGYVDSANLWAYLRAATRDAGLDATALARSLGLQHAEGLEQSAGAFLVRVEKTGVRLEGLALVPEGSQRGTGHTSYQAKLPEAVPAESLLFISGYDLDSTLLPPAPDAWFDSSPSRRGAGGCPCSA